MANTSDDKDKQKPPSLWGFVLLAIIVFLLWLSTPVLVEYFDSSTAPNRGTFGDLYGSVNALFSGLAFAGIIYTILLQRVELRAQREELILTREEMELARKEFEQQNGTLKQQAFETTFFILLGVQRESLKSVNAVNEKKGIIHGIEALVDLSHFGQIAVDNTKSADPSVRYNAYKMEVGARKGYFSEYLLSTNSLLQYVEDGQAAYLEKLKYYTLIVARMRRDEVVFLDRHSTHTPMDKFTSNFKKLINAYNEAW